MWDKAGKLVPGWYQTAIGGDIKGTRGTYDILFSGGVYLNSNEEVWPLDSYTIENDEVVIVGNNFENTELLD